MKIKKLLLFGFATSLVAEQIFCMESGSATASRHRATVVADGVAPIIVSQFRGIAASPQALQEAVGRFVVSIDGLRQKRPGVTRSKARATVALQESFLEFLKGIVVIVESREKKDEIMAMIAAIELEVEAGNFDVDRLNYFAQAAFDTVAQPEDGAGHDPEVCRLQVQYAAMAGRITLFSSMIDESGKGEDFTFAPEIQSEIRVIGAEMVRIARLVAARSRELSSDQREGLLLSAQDVQKNLERMAGATKRITPQAAAKVAVWTVQALLVTSNVLAGQVARLSLTDRPDLVAQRTWYRRAGFCTVASAVALAAALVAGNASGIIDIQIIPSITDLLAPLSGLLSH